MNAPSTAPSQGSCGLTIRKTCQAALHGCLPAVRSAKRSKFSAVARWRKTLVEAASRRQRLTAIYKSHRKQTRCVTRI